MASDFESGALLGHVYTLENGLPVRLRLARSSDAQAIKALLERHDLDSSFVQIAGLVHFDPRRRYVLCATGLVGSSEQLLGLGSIEVGGDEPDLLLVEASIAAELGSLLRPALVGLANAAGRSHAA
jgi:hypothetical protein